MGPRVQVRRTMFLMHIPPSFVSAKHILEPTGPRGGLITTEKCELGLISMTKFPGHPLPVLSGIPMLLKAQLLFQWVFSSWDGTLHWAIHAPTGWFATAEQKSHRNRPHEIRLIL